MVKDIKDTLNLPKTDFPMRANLVAREPARLEHWTKQDLYGAIQSRNRDCPSFVLHDGPPFTNGDLHLGHVLNKTPKDIILRYKSMRGFRTPYIPGWDCHGLPIEQKVSQEIRARKSTLTPLELRQECAAFARRYIETQRTQFQRLGILADWKNEYRTLDPGYEAIILRTFAAFVEQGLVYRDKKPVYWSIPCETALAEAEIEYRDHTSPSIWVKFPFVNPGKLGLNEPVSAVIWTTTPWTLPANLAVAVHPELEYAFVKAGGETYLVANALLERFLAECGLGDGAIVRKVQGNSLEHHATRHPFIDRESPVVLADYVTTESGTGVVHTAPGHGLEDYTTGLKYGLEIYCPLDDRGCFVEDGRVPPELSGITVLETEGTSPANDRVLDLLKSKGNLLHVETIRHSYPHCWRSKTPLIFRAMDQWFVSLDRDDMRRKVLDQLGTVKWIPSWGENRIRGAVENRPDWCISRQRSWGVPIPAFFDENRKALLDPNVIRAFADRVETEGTDLWFGSDSESLIRSLPIPEAWRNRRLKQGTDTLDVWIDSGCSHLAVLKTNPDLSWPADLYLEGSDQHRGWFQSSIWTAVVSEGSPPYKSVLTHGFVVDQDGRKISKSEGKAQTADAYMNQYGADIIRLWVASIDYRNDVPISDEILKHVSDAYRTLRNTLRFQISNLYDFDAASHALEYAELDAIDRWALHQAAALHEQVTDAYEAFEFHRVYQLLTHFCTVTLSATYHDLLKDRLYTLAPGAYLRRSSQTALHHMFDVLVKLAAPILTFTADEAWSYAASNTDFCAESIHLQTWPEIPGDWKDDALAKEMDLLFKLRSDVNEKLEECRKNKVIGKSLEAAVALDGGDDPALSTVVEKYRSFLPELFIVSQVIHGTNPNTPLSITARHAEGVRCPRCWRWVPALVTVEDDMKICPRCNEAIH